MDLDSAQLALGWAYPPPYAGYNADPSSIEADIKVWTHPGSYYAVTDRRGELVAYACFGDEARVPGGRYAVDALDFGGGLRPDLTGRGFGISFFRSVLTFADASFAPARYRTTVAEWNLRATRLCSASGFHVTERFTSEVNGWAFAVHEREAGQVEASTRQETRLTPGCS
ncbi:MAG: GNAT family protein [Planctomycetota bacterium]